MTEHLTSKSTGVVARIRVSLALLAVRGPHLEIAVDTRDEEGLPFREPSRGSSLDELARAMLNEATGSDLGYLEQLYTFSFERDGDPEVVISYLGLAPHRSDLSANLRWTHVNDLDSLSDDDRVVAEYALVRLRAKIGYTTIAFHLMPESFAFSELQQTYESILDRPLDPRNFRRRMVSSGLVQPENRLRREGSHRPAALYRFSGAHDPGSYLTPSPSPSTDQRESERGEPT